MSVKIKLTAIFFASFITLFVPGVTGASSVNLFQITNDSSQQSQSLIYKDLVAYTNFGGSQGIDIWGYNLEDKVNFPIIEKAGQQFLTGLFGNLIVYEDVDNSSNYDVRLFNIKKNKDILIAGGSGAQTSGVTNGDFVVYIDGGACGSIHAYNLDKKSDKVIDSGGCQPLRISDNTVIWAAGASGGSNIYGYDLKKNKPLDIALYDHFQESPNIFEDSVVWYEYNTGAYGDHQSIKLKNLKSGLVKTIYETDTDSLQNPAVSNRYAVWSQSPSQHVNKVMGADLKTGEVFEVQPQGPHQNSHTSPAMWRNKAVWMSFRTGNGDIYGAELNK